MNSNIPVVAIYYDSAYAILDKDGEEIYFSDSKEEFAKEAQKYNVNNFEEFFKEHNFPK